MSLRTILFVVVAALGAASSLWWWFIRCGRTCRSLEGRAEALFEQGEFLSALTLIDAVDARCHCERFTSGDASPQYALAEASVEQLLESGRADDVERALTRARGPILRDLGRRVKARTR